MMPCPPCFRADPDWKSYDPLADVRSRIPTAAANLEDSLAAILADPGTYTRSYVDFIRLAPAWVSADPYATAAPRRKPADIRGPAYIAAGLLILSTSVLLILYLVRSRRRTGGAVKSIGV